MENIKQKFKIFISTFWFVGIVVFCLWRMLEIWSASVSNDASMNWNIYVTISSFGAMIIFMLFVIFLEILKDRFYKRIENLEQG